MSFSLLSWNIMDHGPIRNTFGDQIVCYIKENMADIVCLQEARIDSDIINRTRAIGSYDAVVPQRHSMYDGLPNTNVILTTHEIVGHGEHYFNLHADRVKNRIGDMDTGFYIWSDIRIKDHIIRIYNCHFKLIGVGIKERIKSLKHIAHHVSGFKGPVIICGDMNTLVPRSGFIRLLMRWFHKIEKQSMVINGVHCYKEERVIFSQEAQRNGFTDALPIDHATWAIPYTSFELFKMKSDWMLYRRFTSVKAHTGPYISDHRPVHSICTI